MKTIETMISYKVDEDKDITIKNSIPEYYLKDILVSLVDSIGQEKVFKEIEALSSIDKWETGALKEVQCDIDLDQESGENTYNLIFSENFTHNDTFKLIYIIYKLLINEDIQLNIKN